MQIDIRYEGLTAFDELGIDWIEHRILELGDLLSERCRQRGISLRYDFERPRRSGISIVESPSGLVSEVHARLTANHIFVSIRSGAIRLSPHYFNTKDEIERIVSMM